MSMCATHKNVGVAQSLSLNRGGPSLGARDRNTGCLLKRPDTLLAQLDRESPPVLGLVVLDTEDNLLTRNRRAIRTLHI